MLPFTHHSLRAASGTPLILSISTATTQRHQRRQASTNNSSNNPTDSGADQQSPSIPPKLHELFRLRRAGSFQRLQSKKVKRLRRSWADIGMAESMVRGHLHEISHRPNIMDSRSAFPLDGRVPTYQNASFLDVNTLNTTKNGDDPSPSPSPSSSSSSGGSCGSEGEMIVGGIFDTQSVFPLGVCPPTTSTRSIYSDGSHTHTNANTTNSTTTTASMVASNLCKYLLNHRGSYTDCATWARDVKKAFQRQRGGDTPTKTADDDLDWVCEEYVELIGALASQRRSGPMSGGGGGSSSTVTSSMIRTDEISYYALLADKRLISSIVSNHKAALAQYKTADKLRTQQLEGLGSRVAVCKKMLDDAIKAESPAVVITRLEEKLQEATLRCAHQSNAILEEKERADDRMRHIAFNSPREGCSGVWFTLTALPQKPPSSSSSSTPNHPPSNLISAPEVANLSMSNAGNSRAFVLRRELFEAYWGMLLGDWGDKEKYGSICTQPHDTTLDGDGVGGATSFSYKSRCHRPAAPTPVSETPAPPRTSTDLIPEEHKPENIKAKGNAAFAASSAVGFTTPYVAAHHPQLKHLITAFRSKAILPLTRDLSPDLDDENSRIKLAVAGVATDMDLYKVDRSVARKPGGGSSSTLDYESMYSDGNSIASRKYNTLMGTPPLAITRGFGFPTYKANLRSAQKQQIVIADPQTGSINLQEGDVFVLANRAVFEGTTQYEALHSLLQGTPTCPAMSKEGGGNPSPNNNKTTSNTLTPAELVLENQAPQINVDVLVTAIVEGVFEQLVDTYMNQYMKLGGDSGISSTIEPPSLDSCMRDIDMSVVSSQVLSKMATYGNPKHMHIMVGRISTSVSSSSSSLSSGNTLNGDAEVATTQSPPPSLSSSSTRVEVGPIYPTTVSQSPLCYSLLVEDAKWLYPPSSSSHPTNNNNNDVLVAKLLSDRWGMLAGKLLGVLRQSPMPPQRVGAMLHKALSTRPSTTVIAHPTANIFSPLRWVFRTSLGPLFGHEAQSLLDSIEEEWSFFKGGPPSFWRVALPNGLVSCPDPSAYEGLAEEDETYFIGLAETLRNGLLPSNKQQ